MANRPAPFMQVEYDRALKAATKAGLTVIKYGSSKDGIWVECSDLDQEKPKKIQDGSGWEDVLEE